MVSELHRVHPHGAVLAWLGEVQDEVLLPHTEVEFEFDGETVRIVRAKTGKKEGRGTTVAAHPRGRGDVATSTDAIMALTRGRRPA